MAGPTVLESPASRDYFTLDGQRSPGLAFITSGGEAAERIEDQQQPLTRGSNTVVRGTKNSVTTYELTLWEQGHLETWNKWEAMFLTGRALTPPRVYSLVDLRYSWVTKVIFEAMTPEKRDKPGGPWIRTLTLHEYKRIRPYGGPLVPGALDDLLKAQTAENAANSKTIASLQVQLSHVPPGKKMP